MNMTRDKMKKISVVINTLNEEHNIRRCIESVKRIADEIVICDMYSQDRTVEIAKEYRALVIYHEKTGYVEPARYYAISNASCEWVLVIDADEVMTEKLAGKLEEIVREDKVDVVFLGMLYNYFGKFIRYGGFFNNNNFPRLFRKKVYIETYDKRDEFVHNQFFNLKEKVRNRIKLPLDYFIEHYDSPTIKSYIDKTIGMYSFIEAQNMLKVGKRFKLYMLIFEPLKVFVMAYIIRAGFLDGVEGFMLCVFYAVFRFSVWANLWFLERNSQRCQCNDLSSKGEDE